MKLFKNTKTFILKVSCSSHKMIQISGFISLIFAFTVSFCYHSLYNRKKKYFSKFAKIRFLTKPNETKFALVFLDFWLFISSQWQFFLLQCTPLHRAAENGHVEVVRYLKEHGADVHLRNSSGVQFFSCSVSNAKKFVNLKQ